MNRLVIIGNGFDLAHGLKTSYKDFIEWYWEQRVEEMILCHKSFTEDTLCKVSINPECGSDNWYLFFWTNFKWKQLSGKDAIDLLKERHFAIIKQSDFFCRITQSIETKGWVDIENEYYSLLKKNKDNLEECTKLNNQLKFLQDKLVEYLGALPKARPLQTIDSILLDTIRLEDIARNNVKRVVEEIDSSEDEYKQIDSDSAIEQKWTPQKIMILSFNYTETVGIYKRVQNDRAGGFKNIECNYIHGDLANPQSVIFGYGDELDKDFKTILDANENELLKHSKNNLYLETNHYRKMLEFIESAPFQVYIMGHSCGLSDRTLLNTIFEHDNCVSIKPYYYKKEDGSDNYLELVQNISRSFTDMKLYRARVVNKERCEPLPQI